MLASAMRKLAFLFIVMMGIVPSGPSFAQQNNAKAAEQHFNAGQKAYSAGEYDKAMKEFLAAYQAFPANTLLFNIGQTYRMQGDKEKALAYYEKYVEFEPSGGQVSEAKQHIKELKEDVEAARRQKEAEDQARAQAEAEAQAKAKADADRKRAEEEARRRAEADSAGSGLRTGGLVVAGAGVVAAGVGVALIAGDSKGAGYAIGGAGIGAVAIGTVMYFIGVGQRNDAQAQLGKTALLVPSIGNGAVGLSWVGNF
jgi:tetratricopeptide (TPR) repeat protein